MRRFIRHFYGSVVMVAVQCLVIVTMPETPLWEEIRLHCFVTLDAALLLWQTIQWQSRVQIDREIEDLQKRAAVLNYFKAWDQKL